LHIHRHKFNDVNQVEAIHFDISLDQLRLSITPLQSVIVREFVDSLKSTAAPEAPQAPGSPHFPTSSPPLFTASPLSESKAHFIDPAKAKSPQPEKAFEPLTDGSEEKQTKKDGKGKGKEKETPKATSADDDDWMPADSPSLARGSSDEDLLVVVAIAAEEPHAEPSIELVRTRKGNQIVQTKLDQEESWTTFYSGRPIPSEDIVADYFPAVQVERISPEYAAFKTKFSVSVAHIEVKLLSDSDTWKVEDSTMDVKEVELKSTSYIALVIDGTAVEYVSVPHDKNGIAKSKLDVRLKDFRIVDGVQSSNFRHLLSFDERTLRIKNTPMLRVILEGKHALCNFHIFASRGFTILI